MEFRAASTSDPTVVPRLEVARLSGGGAGIRDARDEQVVLFVTPQAWREFRLAVAAGEFDLPGEFADQTPPAPPATQTSAP